MQISTLVENTGEPLVWPLKFCDLNELGKRSCEIRKNGTIVDRDEGLTVDEYIFTIPSSPTHSRLIECYGPHGGSVVD